MAAPDISRLHQLFHYNKETGYLIWKPREATTGHIKTWNTKHAGNAAGSISAHDGYWYVTIDNRNFKAHRVIFAIVEGRWPDEVDHINRKKSDNRWKNLRESSRPNNMRNIGTKANNTSGHKGVYSAKGKWRAFICVRGKQVSLGTYAAIEDAVNARKAAEAKYWHS